MKRLALLRLAGLCVLAADKALAQGAQIWCKSKYGPTTRSEPLYRRTRLLTLTGLEPRACLWLLEIAQAPIESSNWASGQRSHWRALPS
jgi:hypothetical protein